MDLHIPALPDAFLDRVRTASLDDQAQPVRRLVAEGGEPCRDVLRRARPGEELILASFSPFWEPGPFRELGPVYVLAEPSDEAVPRDRLPLPAGEPTDYLGERFVLRAYGPDQSIVGGAIVEAGTAVEQVEELLRSSDVAFVDVRFPVFGCFACRVERADSEVGIGFRYADPATASSRALA